MPHEAHQHAAVLFFGAAAAIMGLSPEAQRQVQTVSRTMLMPAKRMWYSEPAPPTQWEPTGPAHPAPFHEPDSKQPMHEDVVVCRQPLCCDHWGDRDWHIFGAAVSTLVACVGAAAAAAAAASSHSSGTVHTRQQLACMEALTLQYTDADAATQERVRRQLQVDHCTAEQWFKLTRRFLRR